MTRKSSDSYHDYLIESLKDFEEAAAYLEAALAETPDPKLLKKAFMNVLDALGPEHLSSAQLVQYREKTHLLFDQASISKIYEFVDWFSHLGLKLAVTAEQELKREPKPLLNLAQPEKRQ